MKVIVSTTFETGTWLTARVQTYVPDAECSQKLVEGLVNTNVDPFGGGSAWMVCQASGQLHYFKPGAYTLNLFVHGVGNVQAVSVDVP